MQGYVYYTGQFQVQMALSAGRKPKYKQEVATLFWL